MSKTLDWTHKGVRIIDIRKINKIYVIKICISDFVNEQNKQIEDATLFVKCTIFDERLHSYFLKDAYKVTREEILNVKWNLYITQGHYVKIENDVITEFKQDPNKFYVSFIEIDGPLGTFLTTHKEKHEEVNK